MANAASWFMFLLGVVHIAFCWVRYKAPVVDVVTAGFIDK
jgi:hypothetical protein